MGRKNRTWLCTVLFLDIVGYSKLSVDRQMVIKQHFSETVGESISDFPDEDCINLDTGDGIAICFLGDPEDLLFVAVGLRDNFEDLQNLDMDNKYTVRLGINLGPVKIIEDINGQRNTIGDGINVAQRIMDFAKPNQLLVSRSYFEVVSCLTDSHGKMFSYLGMRKDKHVRQHEVYEVASNGAAPITEEELVNQQAIDAVMHPEPMHPEPVQFSEEDLNRVENKLASYIGPMAKILVKKAAKKSDTLENLYLRLAEDISSDKERTAFLNTRINGK